MNGWNRTKGALAAPFFLCRVGRLPRAGDPQGAAGRPPRGRRAQNMIEIDRLAGAQDMQAIDRLAGAQTSIDIDRLAGAQTYRPAGLLAGAQTGALESRGSMYRPAGTRLFLTI